MISLTVAKRAAAGKDKIVNWLPIEKKGDQGVSPSVKFLHENAH